MSTPKKHRGGIDKRERERKRDRERRESLVSIFLSVFFGCVWGRIQFTTRRQWDNLNTRKSRAVQPPPLFHGNVKAFIQIPFLLRRIYTVWLNRIAHFAVDILLLHHYKRDLAHLSDFDSLVIELSKSER